MEGVSRQVIELISINGTFDDAVQYFQNQAL